MVAIRTVCLQNTMDIRETILSLQYTLTFKISMATAKNSFRLPSLGSSTWLGKVSCTPSGV